MKIMGRKTLILCPRIAMGLFLWYFFVVAYLEGSQPLVQVQTFESDQNIKQHPEVGTAARISALAETATASANISLGVFGERKPAELRIIREHISSKPTPAPLKRIADDEANSLKPLHYVPVDFHPTSPEPAPCPPDFESPLYMLAAHVDMRPLIVSRRPAIQVITIAQNEPVDVSGNPVKHEDIWWHKPGLVSCAIGKLDVDSGASNRIRVVSTSNATLHARLLPKNKYSRLIITCQIPDSAMFLVDHTKEMDLSIYVTLVPTNSQLKEKFVSRWTPLRSRQKLSDASLPRGNMAVCVKELRGGLYSPSIRAWLEYYRLHDFPRFYMHVIPPIDPDTHAVLKLYREAGIVEYQVVLEPYSRGWDGCGDCIVTKATLKTWSDIAEILQTSKKKVFQAISKDAPLKHPLKQVVQRPKRFYANQEALNQDCLMKSFGIHRWVAMIDYDEYLDHAAGLGNRSDVLTMRDRFNQISASQDGPVTAIGFLNAFYCITCNPDLTELSATLRPTMKAVYSKPNSKPRDIGKGLLIPFQEANCNVGGVNNVHERCGTTTKSDLVSLLTKQPGCLFNFNSKARKSTPFRDSNIVLPYMFYASVRQDGFYKESIRSKYVVDSLLSFEAEVHTAGRTVHQFISTAEQIQFKSEAIRTWLASTYTPAEIRKFDTWIGKAPPQKEAKIVWFNPREGYMHHMRTPFSMLPIFKSAASDYQTGVSTWKHDTVLKQTMEMCSKCERSSMVLDFGFVNRYAEKLLGRLMDTCNAL